MSGDGLVTTRELDRRFVRTLPPDMPGDVASAKLRRFQQDREARFKKLDATTSTDEFEAYLHSRGLAFCQWEKWHSRPVETEMAALGAMLMLDDEAVSKGMRGLHARHFARPAHRRVFGAICMVEERRRLGLEPGLQTLDLISVAEQLHAVKEGFDALDKAGGIGYLTELVAACPCSANIDFYIKRMIEESRARHIYYLGHQLVSLAAQPNVSPRRLAAFIRACNRDIARDGWCDFTLRQEQLNK